MTSPAIRQEPDALDEAIARLTALAADDMSEGSRAFGRSDWFHADAIERARGAVERIARLAGFQSQVQTEAGLTVLPWSGNLRTAISLDRRRDLDAAHCEAVDRALARRGKLVVLAVAAMRALGNIAVALHNPLKLPGALRAAGELVTALEAVIDQVSDSRPG